MNQNEINTIIYSKNRPLQLYCLLESITEKTDLNKQYISVLYKYDKEYLESIEEIKIKFNSINFIEEKDFKTQTLDVLKINSKFVMFLMDDDLFTETVNFSKVTNFMSDYGISCFSTRLGKNLNYCYPVSKSQSIPNGYNVEEYFIWNFHEGEFDFNYVLSLDGHIFDKDSFMRILNQCIHWKSPNTLEAEIQQFSSTLNPICACFDKSVLFNMPINRVQNDYQNKHGNLTEKYLLNVWNNKNKINLNKIYGFINTSAHQEIELEFISRK